MSKTDETLKTFGERVGYTASDLSHFSDDDPRVRLMKQMAAASQRYSIVAEVVQAKHCNSGYRAGDKFVLDADGNFITTLCPKRLCAYAVSQLAVPVALINERFSEGLAPNDFHFMRQVRCLDVGAECKGYGGIMMSVAVVPRDGSK